MVIGEWSQLPTIREVKMRGVFGNEGSTNRQIDRGEIVGLYNLIEEANRLRMPLCRRRR